MDKNTITGLVLIAILLVGFSFLSRPSQEQLEAKPRRKQPWPTKAERKQALTPLPSSSTPVKEPTRR